MTLQEEHGAVHRERVLAADRETAWAQLADPEALAGWLADEVDLDEVAPGAEGVLRWDDGAVRLVAVEEVAEGRRVAMRWEDPERLAPDTLVELTLDDHPDGAVLRVVEVPLVALRAVAVALGPAATGRSGPVALAA